MVCNILSNILLLMDCLIISMNECKIDEFDAETFPVIVPVNLALLEKKFEKTLTDLIVPGTKICFTNEVL